MLYNGWSNERQLFFRRIYRSFYSSERSWSFCGLWDRRTGGGREDRLLYWPINWSLDHSTLCCLQDPLSTSASQSGLLNQRPGMGHRPQQARCQWLPAGFDSAFTHSKSLNWLEAAQLEAAALSRALSLTATGSPLAFTAFYWLNCCGNLQILFHRAHLIPIRLHDLLPLIHTGESLIDGSVKGQNITNRNITWIIILHFTK